MIDHIKFSQDNSILSQPFPIILLAMPHRPKSKAQSEGEEFSDVSSGLGCSEDEVVEDNWVFPVVDHNIAKRPEYIEVCEYIFLEAFTSLDFLFQALKNAQLKISELQMTIRKLHMRIAELSTRLKKNDPKHQKSGNKEKLSDSDLCTSHLAKCFGVMHEPFVAQSAFLVARPSVDSTHPDRYHSELSKIQGITAELYEVVPDDLHDELK